MRARAWESGLLAAALWAALAGCGGGGEELLEEEALRECLIGKGFALEPPEVGAGAALGSVSPDFRLRSDNGALVDVVVQGSEEKAKRAAADTRGALQSFGISDAEVVVERNAFVVFESAPSDAAREAVQGCLEG